MIKEIIEKISVKNIEQGEVITPIDTFKTKEVFCDKELKNKCKETEFKKGDEFEIQIETSNELVAFVKNKNVYVVIDKNDLNEFENVD